jgi:epoxyqueuosine reductase QueG
MTGIIENIIIRHLLPAEDYIYGFADLTGLLQDKFDGFNFGISIGLRLDTDIVDKIIEGPTYEYYLHYKKANENLALLIKEISAELNMNDIETFNISPTVTISDLETVYSETLSTDLSHKMVATRAGLGWIGKTDLFISREFGPRLRLVSILIKSPVRSKSGTVDISRCGKCNKCVEICPAKAANGNLWDITINRDEFFDPHKCRNQCAEFGLSRLGMDVRICGICIAACPVGQQKKENKTICPTNC